MSPFPNIRHQSISGKVYTQIMNYIDDNDGECVALAAPADVKLNDEDVFQPDIYVVCDPNKLDDNKCNGAPDWVIEILSPSNSKHDLVTKLEKYKNAGVREYWIIDPEKERVLVYPFAEEKVTGIYTFDDDITVEIYKDNTPSLTICVNGKKRKKA